MHFESLPTLCLHDKVRSATITAKQGRRVILPHSPPRRQFIHHFWLFLGRTRLTARSLSDAVAAPTALPDTARMFRSATAALSPLVALNAPIHILCFFGTECHLFAAAQIAMSPQLIAAFARIRFDTKQQRFYLLRPSFPPLIHRQFVTAGTRRHSVNDDHH